MPAPRALPREGDAMTDAGREVAQENENRLVLEIFNKSSTVTMYVSLDQPGRAGQGVPLPPGGYWSPTRAPMNAIYVFAAASCPYHLIEA